MTKMLAEAALFETNALRAFKEKSFTTKINDKCYVIATFSAHKTSTLFSLWSNI